MSEYDDIVEQMDAPVTASRKDELSEGDHDPAGMSEPVSREAVVDNHTSPSESIIRTPADVPAALERVTGGPTLRDRANVDREWLLRRAGKKR